MIIEETRKFGGFENTPDESDADVKNIKALMESDEMEMNIDSKPEENC